MKMDTFLSIAGYVMLLATAAHVYQGDEIWAAACLCMSSVNFAASIIIGEIHKLKDKPCQ